MAFKVLEDDVYKRMRLAICSGNRRLILLALYEGEKSLGALRDRLGSDPASIIHALRELERYRLVEQDTKRDYALTVIGKLLVQKVIDCHRTAEMLIHHQAFWFDHDVSGIPAPLFIRIGSLSESTLVTSTHEHTQRAYQAFIELVEGGDVLELITPVYAPELADRLNAVIERKKTSSLVLTDAVLRRVINDLGPARVRELLQRGVTIHVTRYDLKLLFVYTGDATGLALSLADGRFNDSQLLISDSSEAITWGRELFHFYVERAERVAL